MPDTVLTSAGRRSFEIAKSRRVRNEALAASLLVVRWVIGWVHHVGNEMKISKSKQELARIISENGGWRNGAEFAWYGNQTKKGWFGISKPRYSPKQKSLQILRPHLAGSFPCRKPKNWHQTILSRAEYFHLYPATDAKPEFCESVMRSIPEPDEQVWTNPPSIEQLAADYRNAKDYAERKQQEADAAKADAEAKLKALELAGEAHGLLVTPITTKQDPELVITDLRDLQLGDEVEYLDGVMKNKIGMVGTIDKFDHNSCTDRFFRIKDGYNFGWPTKWRFIRRP